MRRLTSSAIAAAVALCLAGCGSSSPSSTTTAAGGSSLVVGKSTPVTSPTFRAYLLHSLRSSGLSLSQAQKSATCGIHKFLSQGIKTYAQFLNPKNAAIEHQDGVQCARITGYRR